MALKEPIESAEVMAEVEVQSAHKRAVRKSKPAEEPEYRVYIGPSIRGRALNGAVFSSAQEAQELLAKELSAYPSLGMFLVSGDLLPKARIDVKTPGTALYAEMQKLIRAMTKN